MEKIRGMYVAKTDIGKKRQSNEDKSATLVNSSGDVLLLVCDGMGGHNKGSYASAKVLEVVNKEFSAKSSFFSVRTAYFWLQRVLKEANTDIYNYAQENEDYKDMGTTVVIALLVKNKIIIASAGDSRCYLMDNGKLNQITEDQTYVNHLVKIGKITKEEAKTHKDRHMLINSMGQSPSLSLDMKIIDNEGKSIVLCSDGLYNNITEQELYRALAVNETPTQKIDTVINIANMNGGSDNISIAYWEAFKNA
ncbi:MAG: Stp1/IreP family PP2C-type Ser/Thr phosphatase [Bacilli bacterium]|nr:Stp1/IreP family PP2C-type Ser/Thr phosphatase [Bacilli bacterium]